MRLYYENHADGVAVAVTASSEVSTLPAENVLHDHLARVWRTGASTAAESLVVDLGSAKSVAGIILAGYAGHGYGFDGTEAVAYEANSSNSWGAPAVGPQALTWDSVTNSWHDTYTSGPVMAFRWHRFTFTKPSAAARRDVGRIYLGEYQEITDQPDHAGFRRRINDPTKTQQSVGGQEFSDIREQWEEHKLEFSYMSETDLATLRELFSLKGTGVPWFFQLDTASPLNPMRFVRFTKDLEAKVVAYDSALYYDVSLELKTML